MIFKRNKADLNSHHSRTLIRLKESRITRKEWTQVLYDKFYEEAQLAADGYKNKGWHVTIKDDEVSSWTFYNSLPAK